jgi:hypothetical protein
VLRFVCLTLVIACGSGGGSPATSSTSSAVTAPAKPEPDPDNERAAQQARADQEKHDEIAATHRVVELEQQNAMAASCTEPKPWTKHERCLPSCYPTQQPDARADKKLAGPTLFEHVVCQKGGEERFVIVDEVGGAKLRVQPARGRFPRAHPKRAWQAELAAWFRDEQAAKSPKTDVVIVKGNWSKRTHPLSREKLSCVTVAHYAKAVQGKLDDCGAVAKTNITCEAEGNGAARGINVVHYRVVEAKRLQAAGKTEQCQQAALEAIAVARGMPRWRQYKKLNVDEWNNKLIYKTRFDGMLDEDHLFEAVAALGSEAEALYGACGGSLPTTHVDQEQSFHACW